MNKYNKLNYLFSIIFFFWLTVKLDCSEIEKRNKVDVSIIANISFEPKYGTFVYNFTAISSEKSVQEVKKFYITTFEKFLEITSPTGWKHDFVSKLTPEPLVMWSAGWGDDPRGKQKASLDGNVQPTPYQIKPSHSLSGFSLKSRGIPDIVSFYAFGFRRLIKYKDLPTTYFPRPKGWTILDDAFQGKTVGPVAVKDQSLGGLVDRLVLLSDEVPKYGWIKNSEITADLKAKFQAAKESIAKGKNKTAKQQLNMLIADLDAKKGNEIQENAWALLRANIEYLISKLGN